MGDKGGLAASSHKLEQEERLSKKHIQTLGYVQELVNENKKLRQIIGEYEEQKLHCDDLHAQNDAVSKPSMCPCIPCHVVAASLF